MANSKAVERKGGAGRRKEGKNKLGEKRQEEQERSRNEKEGASYPACHRVRVKVRFQKKRKNPGERQKIDGVIQEKLARNKPS